MDPPEMNSPPLHSRKDQLSINTFKMRNREMSKRLARMNGHGDLNQHHLHQQENMESHSPTTTPRVPTTNGETSHSSTKPMNADASHSHPSTSTPKPSSYHSPLSPKNAHEYRTMRELLTEGDKRAENQQSPIRTHSNGSQQLKINQALQDKLIEKAERESPQPLDNQQPNEMPTSPMQFSNDSNSGDGNFDELQSKFYCFSY
jgi:hypothetical protein